MDVSARIDSCAGSSILEPRSEIGSAPRRVKRKTLLEVLEQCRTALESLRETELEEEKDIAACSSDNDEEDDRSRGSESDEVNFTVLILNFRVDGC